VKRIFYYHVKAHKILNTSRCKYTASLLLDIWDSQSLSIFTIPIKAANYINDISN